MPERIALSRDVTARPVSATADAMAGSQPGAGESRRVSGRDFGGFR